MYQLVSRIQDGLGELKTLLETHIYNQGLAAVEKCGDAALNVRLLVLVWSALAISKLNFIPKYWARLFKTNDVVS